MRRARNGAWRRNVRSGGDGKVGTTCCRGNLSGRSGTIGGPRDVAPAAGATYASVSVRADGSGWTSVPGVAASGCCHRASARSAWMRERRRMALRPVCPLRPPAPRPAAPRRRITRDGRGAGDGASSVLVLHGGARVRPCGSSPARAADANPAPVRAEVAARLSRRHSSSGRNRRCGIHFQRPDRLLLLTQGPRPHRFPPVTVRPAWTATARA